MTIIISSHILLIQAWNITIYNMGRETGNSGNSTLVPVKLNIKDIEDLQSSSGHVFRWVGELSTSYMPGRTCMHVNISWKIFKWFGMKFLYIPMLLPPPPPPQIFTYLSNDVSHPSTCHITVVISGVILWSWLAPETKPQTKKFTLFLWSKRIFGWGQKQS